MDPVICPYGYKLKFHGTDTDTDTVLLAPRQADCRGAPRQAAPTSARGSEVGEEVRVGVAVRVDPVEFKLY